MEGITLNLTMDQACIIASALFSYKIELKERANQNILMDGDKIQLAIDLSSIEDDLLPILETFIESN